MQQITQALAEQTAELDGLLAGLDEAGWATPSACPGWSIADVVLHLTQSDELVVAGMEDRFAELVGETLGRGGHTVDVAAGLAVEAERGASGAEVYARWQAASTAQAQGFAASDARRSLPWVTGPLPARTLATTRLAEYWIHTGDVAGGLGMELAPTGRLWHIARLAWRTIPYAFSQAGLTLTGPVAVHLDAPNGTTWDFTPDEPAVTTVTGPALDFCLVAGRRLPASETKLTATGPDAAPVLDLLRTFA